MQNAILYFFPIVIYLSSCASDQRMVPLPADHKKYDLKDYAGSISGETVVYRDSAGVILDTLITFYEVQFDSVGNEILHIEKNSSGAEIYRKEWRVNTKGQKTGFDELWHNGLYRNYGEYGYGDGQNIISEKRYTADGRLINTFTYTYDSKNRLTATKTEAESNRPEALQAGTKKHEYDSLDRLISSQWTVEEKTGGWSHYYSSNGDTMIIYTTGSTKGNGKVSVYDSRDAKGAWTQKTTTEKFGSDRTLVTIEKRKITYIHP